MIVDRHTPSRDLLRAFFEAAGYEVVATANDPSYGLVIVQGLEVDVVVLDAEIPDLAALEFLENLMRDRPTPVVMLAGSSEASARFAMRGLELGAIDVVEKPALDARRRSCHLARDLLTKVLAAATAVPHAPQLLPAVSTLETKVIAIGAATGGVEAISNIIADLPRESPAIAIAQTLPASMMQALAEYFDRESEICVRVARDGDRLKPGVALVAPGDRQMYVVRSGLRYRVRLTETSDSPIDALFGSTAAASGAAGIGVLLSGNGSDGVRGLSAMQRSGGITIAQDERSSIAHGAARAAISKGVVASVLPLDQIAGALIELGR